jgi:hypothetical protein
MLVSVAKTRNEIIRVGVLHHSVFREASRFTASVSIRQPHLSNSVVTTEALDPILVMFIGEWLWAGFLNMVTIVIGFFATAGAAGAELWHEQQEWQRHRARWDVRHCRRGSHR